MTALDWMTRMSDKELKYDLQCILDAAAPHEHERIEQYRKARMKAPGFLPAKPGANNHTNVRSVPKPVRSRVCECGCGQSLPKLSDGRRKYASDACRVRAHRGAEGDSADVRGGHGESPSGGAPVTELPADRAAFEGRFWYCPSPPG